MLAFIGWLLLLWAVTEIFQAIKHSNTDDQSTETYSSMQFSEPKRKGAYGENVRITEMTQSHYRRVNGIEEENN